MKEVLLEGFVSENAHPVAHGQELVPVQGAVDGLGAAGDLRAQLHATQDAPRRHWYPYMPLRLAPCIHRQG